MAEKERVDAYLDTVNRLEPEIHIPASSAFYASAAISAKRTADATTRAADAIVEYIAWLKARDAFTADLRKRMEEQYKEASPLLKGTYGDGLPADDH